MLNDKEQTIVILDGHTLNPGDLSWKGFFALGSLTVYDRTYPEEVIERIKDATIIITNKTPVKESAIKSNSKLRYIGVLATGYDVVDTKAAEAAGIVITNVPAYGTMAVSQITIALLLEICHHTAHHSAAVFQGQWGARRDFSFWDYPLIELDQKVIGLIGYGRIGRQTGNIAKALGMKVLAYDMNVEDSDIAQIVSVDSLFNESDVICLHCPLNEESYHIINQQNINKMKNGVIIINTARGQLVDEQALADALSRGKVYYAGLDVVSREPIQPDNPLLNVKNCFITPHIAWAPKEARQRLMDIAVNNLKSFLVGNPVNLVR